MCINKMPAASPSSLSFYTQISKFLLFSYAMAISNLITFSLFSLLDVVAASLTSTGQTLLLNDIPYYVPATPFTTISPLTSLNTLYSASGLVPVTIVGVSASNSSLSNLESIINGFSVDDVWNEGFLEGECKQIFGYWGPHRSSAYGTELEIFILIPRRV